MRSLLDKLYLAAGALSGLCIIAICCIILARVIGRWVGIEVPSSDDFAGFLLAAASFLGLAYTFRQGGHIRVSLFTSRLSAAAHKRVEKVILSLGCILIVYLSWQLVYMVYESHLFEELSSGYVPVPLWIVQLPLALGMIIFSVAVIDQTCGCFFLGEELPKSEEEELAESAPIELTDVDKSLQMECKA